MEKQIPTSKTEDYQHIAESVRNARNGIAKVFRTELNFRRHCLIAVIVIIVGMALEWDYMKWCLATLAIVAVLGTEMINTAIEYSWNHLEPNHHPVVGTIKDVMAGAVLVVSIGAGVVGLLLIFS